MIAVGKLTDDKAGWMLASVACLLASEICLSFCLSKIFARQRKGMVLTWLWWSRRSSLNKPNLTSAKLTSAKLYAQRMITRGFFTEDHWSACLCSKAEGFQSSWIPLHCCTQAQLQLTSAIVSFLTDMCLTLSATAFLNSWNAIKWLCIVLWRGKIKKITSSKGCESQD